MTGDSAVAKTQHRPTPRKAKEQVFCCILARKQSGFAFKARRISSLKPSDILITSCEAKPMCFALLMSVLLGRASLAEHFHDNKLYNKVSFVYIS